MIFWIRLAKMVKDSDLVEDVLEQLKDVDDDDVRDFLERFR